MRKTVLWASTAEDQDSIIEALVEFDGIDTEARKKVAGRTITKGHKCPETCRPRTGEAKP